MNFLLLVSSLIASLTGTPDTQPDQETPTAPSLPALLQCRAEPSPLVRVDCYDRLLDKVDNIAVIPLEKTGPVWRQAMEQEMKRTDHSTGFITTQSDSLPTRVILTTPAIGVPPPRPVLMLSCIDNITRIQIALAKPQDSGTVMMSTEITQFSADWFLRENGYLLESSRGLPGIEELKRLMTGKTLTIKTGNGNRMTFNISQLEQAVKPLRSACRW
ncbi:type VI secretion system-associated protein TagO [Photorhabdus laumondii subsp. laumondii]|uniref:Photorhabdus luminescens subsp. laumondii TTO1 complete genome segment 2/17 n=2 Tax=Photorhabdus laumondii subsp. laumondii TaxID=141679 RepID=Q7N9H5_PHOLL|nr:MULTISPECIES: type VI secretion system-associated protein VasI [Photorhabdus]AWK40333.1 type VI secretion system-associated protein [Photorhabdus laumondii subsp. laumondii]AXG41144.1 type VI secretion system-associated protein TagO [Photorhabdus laumondii subsp. laumondii]AXG45672.1 type VI secretion system-associated protein TagO [Photorhabdus laumondii subsp. laumondii]KTL62766.1 type VI secretion protein [Photorhabdus laumondii subsp. laumondii]MCC8385725.1 type VI secretion system-asso